MISLVVANRRHELPAELRGMHRDRKRAQTATYDSAHASRDSFVAEWGATPDVTEGRGHKQVRTPAQEAGL